jgi:hypothetical protein
MADVPRTTAHEIQVLMSHLGKMTANVSDDPRFDLTAIAARHRVPLGSGSRFAILLLESFAGRHAATRDSPAESGCGLGDR